MTRTLWHLTLYIWLAGARLAMEGIV